ncbi:hypothetical protein H4Q26_000785 [Puccinia striiformis f. sp. tritici PST-130]|nr:hypothetical protein H4Q26_000785 [Puccinia striiformis f. sp. tritici PST-130]
MMTQQRVASPQSSEDRFDLDDDLGACIFHTSFSATVIWYPPKHTAGWQAMRGGPLFGERALDMVILLPNLKIKIQMLKLKFLILACALILETYGLHERSVMTSPKNRRAILIPPPRDHYPFINKDYSPDASDEDAAKSAPNFKEDKPKPQPPKGIPKPPPVNHKPPPPPPARKPKDPKHSAPKPPPPPPDHKPTGPTHGKPRPPPPSPAHKPKKPKNGAPKPPPHPPALKPKDLKDGGSKKKLPPKPPHKEGPKEGPKYSKPDASTPK